MTKAEAVLELLTLVVGLPPGTLEEQTAKVAERLAVHAEADVLTDVLIELALQRLVEGGACPLLLDTTQERGSR